MSEYVIEAEGLVKRYGKHTALDGVDLRARPGTVLSVLGPNGAGKTTSIRILATLTGLDAGSARVGGMDVVRQAANVRRIIGLTGQYATLDEELTGLGNLILIGRLLDLRQPDAARRAAELVERFGLTEAAKKPVATYSGGMRRRLDLAASLVGNPRVVFLDEPSVGLDPGKREELWRIIRELTADGVSVLLTTQYLEEADALADEISVIDQGRVIAHGTPPELKQIIGGQAIATRPLPRPTHRSTSLGGRPLVERRSVQEGLQGRSRLALPEPAAFDPTCRQPGAGGQPGGADHRRQRVLTAADGRPSQPPGHALGQVLGASTAQHDPLRAGAPALDQRSQCLRTAERRSDR